MEKDNRLTEYDGYKSENKQRGLPILFERKENCCGCSACYAICPFHAINMEVDEEGFLYPQINSEKCMRCYSCLSVCKFKKDQKQDLL